jgi:hypothetical protein
MEVSPNSSEAACWCASGAIQRAGLDLVFIEANAYVEARYALANAIPSGFADEYDADNVVGKIQKFNDDRNTTFEMVRLAFLKAKDSLKAEHIS